DQSLALYARRHEIVTSVLADAVKAGDDQTVVGDAIVAAASDARPKAALPGRKAREPGQQGAPLRARGDLRRGRSASSTSWRADRRCITMAARGAAGTPAR